MITAPVIRSVIGGGQGEISGAFSATEASDLALLLRAGALPAPLEVAEERTVGPELGSDAISIGMAVDANILINERIREESRRGRSPLMALDAGFKRAFRTILDSNVTTLIAISLLFMVGSGPVRGFAVTMGVG